MPKGTKNANAIRALAMDAVQKQDADIRGAPMGMAEIAEVLWINHLKHNPKNPGWPDRDRFVLSNGHGSMLLYSMLHLSGYDLSIEQLKISDSLIPKQLVIRNMEKLPESRQRRARSDKGSPMLLAWPSPKRFIKQI